MLRALQNLLGVQPWRTSEEAWGEPLAYDPATGQITFLFTNTASFARDPQFLSRWGWQVRAMNDDLYPPRTSTDYTLRNWVKRPATSNRVEHLLGESDLGFDLFAATVYTTPQVVGADYDVSDLNGSLLRLNAAGPLPTVTGPVGTQLAAHERLGALHRVGAKAVFGARVQANHTLYSQGVRSAPAMCVFSFEPAISPMKLEEIAEMIFELKSSDTQNPVLLAAAAGPRASDEFWFYHRRFRLPPELTEGRAVYCGDLWVHRPFLPDGYFSARTPRLLPLLAQPGDMGGIELIPHDSIAQIFPPAQASLFRVQQ